MSKLKYICVFMLSLMLAGCGGSKTKVDNTEIDRLTAELTEVTAARTAAETMVTELEGQLADAQAAGTVSQDRITELEGQLETAREELAVLQQAEQERTDVANEMKRG